MADIKKILVANRGEIALRVIHTCKELGIESVAVYSRPDADSPHVLHADESVFIGEAASSESYLVIDKIIDAAKQTGADAIHPGYGFLSENASFSERCEKEGIIFIGPKPKAISLMGDKTEARELVTQAGIPTPPGLKSELKDIEEARRVADDIGYPILVKAAAGGGGKGMRIVHKKEEFEASIKAAKSEARNAFGDDRIYIEKYLEQPRHVEFQIIADTHGKILHVFDRECSVQRRHQKVIEEAPCAILTPELRSKMAEAAIKAARACDYIGAGTIEFMVDKNLDFYFLEMNTRLQVEHPVTEMISGVDLVALQILVAEGKELPFEQDDLSIDGHAIECRIYAEDPADKFLPSTGLLKKHRVPTGSGVRVDAGVEEGQKITINYDPMISKLSVHGPTREIARKRMLRALDEYEIAGCKTTIPFCEFTLNHPAFINAEYDTHFVPDHFTPEKMQPKQDESDVALAAALLKNAQSGESSGTKQKALVDDHREASQWWKKRRA
ncbi:acetyl-CoA carboxylase biotin carboxylase subunit [Gracilimonas mengyeensis]|uniref:Propionyl-CoA carboxylase alpha chain n=1 Tax=Gracilimonas mengyeensis TaxID=1302730 RepID=A0A521ATD7_9BACT|nr:acetyl-CoA carboxylase biotin carboxylase subunit [Gracilimonas mengyeensis]SMO38074.1 propionyl-CoA carboxylase alpha chain [Gracilimonas mengyeensis]